VTGHWDIALRDLDRVLSLDANGDGALTWAELSAQEQTLTSYALSRLTLDEGGQPCRLRAQSLSLVEHSDGAYARLPIVAHCLGATDQVTLRYQFLFDIDAQHRAIARLVQGTRDRSLVLGAETRITTFSRELAGDDTSSSMIAEGIRHILAGLDHVLFLLALLLPVVLRPKSAASSPAPSIRVALRDVFKVVTAFTIAHSITLGLATLGIATIPPRIIEPAIAASVAIAALDNLWPVFGKDRWSVAFALGLLHGFGFSSALSDVGLSAGGLLQTLFAFNLGVELGQLAIVSLFVPLAFLFRRAWLYQFLVVRGGSLAIVVVSFVWLVERIGEG
jgi:hypothetical protein